MQKYGKNTFLGAVCFCIKNPSCAIVEDECKLTTKITVFRLEFDLDGKVISWSFDGWLVCTTFFQEVEIILSTKTLLTQEFTKKFPRKPITKVDQTKNIVPTQILNAFTKVGCPSNLTTHSSDLFVFRRLTLLKKKNK